MFPFLKNKPRVVQVVLVALLLASLWGLGAGVRRFVLLSSYGGIPVRDVPFTLESALQYRRVKMILDRHDLPKRDDMVQQPEGIEPAKTYTVFVDRLQASLCRVLPDRLDTTEKLRWIEMGWFCLSIPLLALWGRRATGRWSAGAVAGFLYAVSIAAVQRSTGAELSTENTAFPFLAAHFLFRAAGRRPDQRNSFQGPASAAGLALAVLSWDLMQFYLFLWAGLGCFKVLRRQWLPSDPGARVWMWEWAALVAVALGNEYHRFHGLLLSPPMLAASAGMAVLLLRGWRTAGGGLSARTVWIVALCALAVFAVAGRYAGSYGHFLDLLWAKLRFLNVKPADPSVLTFSQRLMWTPALHSPTILLTVQILAVLLALNLPAALAVGRNSRNNLDVQQPLIGFVCSALAYVFFFRFHVFVAFFGAMLAALWWARAAGGEGRWPVAARVWIALGLFLELAHTLRGPWHSGSRGHPGQWGQREGIYYEEQIELTNWLAKHAAPDTVLAGFGISGPVAAYGKCGIVLHPKFETQALRDKVRTYAEQLFSGTLSSFRDWADRQGAMYFVYGMGSFATNEPTLQLRYMVNAMNPPPTAPARFFEAGKEDRKYWRQVFSNRKYRVYRMLTKGEEVAAGVALRRAGDAFERGDLEGAEAQATAALKADPNCTEADRILQHVVSLRGKGFSTDHEPRR